MAKRTPQQNEAIDRLAAAMTFYRERLPADPGKRSAFVKQLAKDFKFSIQTIRHAIQLMRQMTEGNLDG